MMKSRVEKNEERETKDKRVEKRRREADKRAEVQEREKREK